MTMYCLNIVRDMVSNDGLTKPRSDIAKILRRDMIQSISVPILNGKKEKFLFSWSRVSDVLNWLHEGDKLIINYPTDMGVLFDQILVRRLRRLNIKLITLIHDIDALRFEQPFYKGISYETRLLNYSDAIISPNKVMSEKLVNSGVKSNIVNLNLFDYLTDVDVAEKRVFFSKKVSFAGNLNKSEFIFDLLHKKTEYSFYGPIKKENKTLMKSYQGSYDSNVLIRKIDNGFGLIWDGESAEFIDATNISSGSYLLYNNPYKLSFYIAAGIPVIIWRDAAAAQFVENNSIGLLVSSLDEVDLVLEKLGSSEYEQMQKNVRGIQKKVVKGYYTLRAVRLAEKSFMK